MNTIGLIGGMSWQSTAEYYRIINEAVRERLGGLHSARCLLWSFDFQEIDTLQHRGDWTRAAQRMVEAARAVARAGADCIVLCTNTMHRMADQVQAAIGIPLLHIADATAEAVHAAGLLRVGLLATRFTMEGEFYAGRLNQKHKLDLLVPQEPEREVIHRVIYDELCAGRVQDASRRHLQAIIEGLARAGAQGIILGCTELGLLIGPDDSPLPLFDTTRIHATAAVDFALR